MLNIDLLSPLAVHSLYAIIKQWQDTDQDDEYELLEELLNPSENNISYLCAEHRPNLAKIMRADSYQKLLDNQDNDLFTDILDGFDYLFLDEYVSMQNRLREMFDNGYTLDAFNDDINTLLSNHKHKLTCLEFQP